VRFCGFIEWDNEAVPEIAVSPGMANPPQEDRSPPVDYSEDGVDLTLIRWMLSLTAAERLQFLQKQVNGILAIRRLNARR
jgi:hypothetical protein